MAEAVGSKIMDFLKENKHLRLATVSEEGTPSVRTVSYVSYGHTVYFLTDKKSRKVKDIVANGLAAYSVDDDHLMESQLKGLQIQGRATVVEDEKERKTVVAMMYKKFPQMRVMPLRGESVVVRLDPEKGFFFDNTEGFGHREEFLF